MKTVKDLNNTKKNESARLKTLWALFNKSLDILYLVDAKGYIKEANTSLCNLTGYLNKELLRKSIFDITTNFNQAKLSSVLNQAKSSGSTEINLEYKNKQHKTTKIKSGLILIEISNKQYLLSFGRRQIARKKLENKYTEATNALLGLFAKKTTRKEYLDSLVEFIKDWTNCNCIGIRIIDKKNNIPYESYIGFSKKFWQSEHWLSTNKHKCSCPRIIAGKPNSLEKKSNDKKGFFLP